MQMIKEASWLFNPPEFTKCLIWGIDKSDIGRYYLSAHLRRQFLNSIFVNSYRYSAGFLICGDLNRLSNRRKLSFDHDCVRFPNTDED